MKHIKLFEQYIGEKSYDDLKEIVKMETEGAFKFGDPTEAAEKYEMVFYANHKNNKALNQKFKDLATKAAKEAQKRLSVTYEIKQDIDDDAYTLIVFDVTDM